MGWLCRSKFRQGGPPSHRSRESGGELWRVGLAAEARRRLGCLNVSCSLAAAGPRLPLASREGPRVKASSLG